MNTDNKILIDPYKVIEYNETHEVERTFAWLSNRGIPTMKDMTAIKQLSRKEKLQVMEAIWEDLSQEDHLVESPAWHESQLKETEQQVQAGTEQRFDWLEAKKELRKRFE